jgi:glucose-6-phosphate isomerase
VNGTFADSWPRFQHTYLAFPDLGLALDFSRVPWPENFQARMEKSLARAFDEMARLERGERVNTTENRRVGHYWLRTPELLHAVDDPELRRFAAEIPATVERIKAFAARVHTGQLAGQTGRFEHLLVIGIGGSALGPQLAARALGHPARDRLQPWFFDNTDPDGMDLTLAALAAAAPDRSLQTALGRTLCVVISKSGGTPETANGQLEAAAAYARAGLRFEAHAVAVTLPGSRLHRLATDPARPWLDAFPLWDWVGGRTSETSAVGLLPAALQGLDIDGLLAGARACDAVTRVPDPARNPAARLALAWWWLTDGRGTRDMVVLPYKDRLELFARYLQQLVMESLGKETNRAGDLVRQGLTVYGNKGSTDQHAYVQQLREGVPNFFVTFIEVLRDHAPDRPRVEVEPGITSGDYLAGFLLGTRQALWENGRPSITLTLDEVNAHRLGVLIALFERTVGLYAGLVNINAYDQPGVEAGKRAAARVLRLQRRLVEHLRQAGPRAAGGFTAEQLAAALGPDEDGRPTDPELVFKLCEHLAANPGRGVVKVGGTTPADSAYAGE